MSTSNQQSSPYSRDNFYGGDDEYHPNQDPPRREFPGTDKHAFRGKSILSEQAELGCPLCGGGADGEATMSDPECRPPLVERIYDYDPAGDSMWTQKHDHRRHRYCERCSAVIFGGVLLNQPAEEFLGIVETWLSSLVEYPSSLRETVFRHVQSRKARGFDDAKNLTIASRELEFGPDEE